MKQLLQSQITVLKKRKKISLFLILSKLQNLRKGISPNHLSNLHSTMDGKHLNGDYLEEMTPDEMETSENTHAHTTNWWHM